MATRRNMIAREKKQVIQVVLPDAVATALKARAARESRSVSSLIRFFLLKGVHTLNTSKSAAA